MKACKHNDVVEYIIRRDTFERIRHVCIISDPEARICRDCGAWLSLGHSEEAPVSVEVRAAEIAATPLDQFASGPALRAVADGAEIAGWIGHAFDSAKAHDRDGEWAGWLAREIHTHDGGGE